MFKIFFKTTFKITNKLTFKITNKFTFKITFISKLIKLVKLYKIRFHLHSEKQQSIKEFDN
jgi:hypothetical protein